MKKRRGIRKIQKTPEFIEAKALMKEQLEKKFKRRVEERYRKLAREFDDKLEREVAKERQRIIKSGLIF